MKLLYISNSRIPTEKAHGIQIMKTCEAFSLAGVDVKLVVPTRHNPTVKNSNPFDYYGVQKNFEIETLKSLDPYWLIKLPQGIYIKFQALLFVMKLQKHLKAVDGLGSQTVYTREEYLLPVIQKHADNVIWEAHNLPRNKERYVKYWQKCKNIVVISEGLKRDLLSLGIPADKILVAPDGVDLDKFEFRSTKPEIRKELGLSADQKVVMYSGHLYDWKGASVLLEVARNSKSKIPNSKFVFVGGTDADIKKFKKEAQGLDNVLILGHKPFSEIPRYLAAADVLVLPNSARTDISKKFTSPLKMFEYMASDRPIIASDLPSIREVLNDNNAVLVEPDDSEALARGIGKVFQDQKLAEKISRQAQKDVKEYTWEKRAVKIVEKFI